MSAWRRGTRLYPRGLSARGDAANGGPRTPRGAGGLARARVRADLRTRVGWVGRVPPGCRAEPDLPRDALGPWPRDFGASRPRLNRGFGALSASARTRVFHRDGRGRRQDAGRRAHDRAGDREAEDPETPPCEGRAQRRINRKPLARPPATASDAADLLDGRARFAQSRCRPAFERLRKRPSRAGRAEI